MSDKKEITEVTILAQRLCPYEIRIVEMAIIDDIC